MLVQAGFQIRMWTLVLLLAWSPDDLGGKT